MVSECSVTENSVCTRCESGHYQQSWTKERHCAPHDICEDSKCSLVPTGPSLEGLVSPPAHLPGVSPCPCSLCPDAGLIVKTQGNATHNTVCQCRVGMHCSDSSCQTCVENQPCQRGFGFVAGESDQLLPRSGTDTLAALTPDPPGKGGLPQQGAPSRASGELCLPLRPGSIAMGRAAHLTPTAPHLPQPVLTFLQPLLLPSQGCGPDVIPLRALCRRHLLQCLF